MTITGDNGDNTLQGGWGAQTILGLGGDDIIFGDPTSPPSAPFFLIDAARDPGALDGAHRLASASVGGATYIYATALEDGGLTAWRLDADLALEPVFAWTTFTYPGPVQIGGRALRAVEFAGIDYLISSGLGLSISAIGADGALTHLATVYDDPILNIDQPVAVTAFETGGQPYIVASGWNGQGFSVFRIDSILGFVHVESHADAADTTLRQVVALETVVVDGAVYVVATGFHDSGVTVYAVGAGGALTRTDHDTTELSLIDERLDGAQALAVHHDGQSAYIYVGAAYGALSVYRLEPGGALTLLESHPGTYADLQVATLNGQTQLFATGMGQTVDVYDVAAGGLLAHAGAFATTGAGDAGAATLVATADGVFMAVALETDDGVDLFQAAIGGDDVIDGGDGDDWIRGGAGNDTITGGPGADQIWGDDGDDLIFGNDGADVLIGGSGDDRIEGGLKNDMLRGNAGADTLIGGAGADTAYGGSGGDTLLGGNGADKLYGGIGADVIRGGPGADVVTGNNGDDWIEGGSGADLLQGGPGADTILGGGGPDRLKGGSGPDVLTGGAGADVFEFAMNSNRDVVTDFNRSVDLIEIVGFSGGYGGLAIVQAGPDALVSFGNVEITFENTSVSDLDAGAFLFS